MTTPVHVKTLTGEILVFDLSGIPDRGTLIRTLHTYDPEAYPLERTDVVETAPGWYMTFVCPPMSVKLVESKAVVNDDTWKYTFYHSVDGMSSYEEHEVVQPRTARETEQVERYQCRLPNRLDILAHYSEEDGGIERYLLNHLYSTRPHHLYTACGDGEKYHCTVEEFLDHCRHDWSDDRHCKRLTEEAKSSIKRLLAIYYRREVAYPVPAAAAIV